MLTLPNIQEALKNIRDHIHRTPLIYSNSFSKMTGAKLYLKAENLQKTGSFKVRGAFNKMARVKGNVIAASMGNHAQAVAFAAERMGIHAKIIMPRTAPIVKEEATRGYGAEVVLHGESFKEALDYAISQEEYIFIHAFDDEEVIAGQGTIGIEIMDDLKDVDILLVPVGGGGLISGIATAVKALSPKTEVIGVQTESATSAHASFKEKKICEKTPLSTIADGIAIGRIGNKTFEIINNYVDDMILVSEDSIAMAILLFLERKKLVVEGAGAVPLAALLENREKFAGKKIVLVVSGGNIDFTLVDRIIHKGLMKSGRIGAFEVTVDDVPGSLHSLTGVIAFHRANILDVVHNRLASDLRIGKTRVGFTIEARNREHFERILEDLNRKGFETRKKTES
ncbi:MAG: threonine ammonia-lyase [Nitrospirae bacterium RBG_13_43_8]|nr:MAG: threonine ammonia-lyase [Nitrospirae bacterium RBG_13_43_8]